ncbi:MAG TPA: hypothetical protein VGH74_18410, partial [Planctomycetaceae bacterium]
RRLKACHWHMQAHFCRSAANEWDDHKISPAHVKRSLTEMARFAKRAPAGWYRCAPSSIVDRSGEDEAKRRDLPGGPNAQVRVLSPDGRLAALAEANKVRVFDTSTGKETCQVDSANDDFRRLIFSQDSARLVIVDDQIRWLSAVSGELAAAVDQKLGGKTWAGRSARSLALSAPAARIERRFPDSCRDVADESSAA